MNRIWIPAHLQHLTNGNERVKISGSNIRHVIQALDNAYPGLGDQLREGDMLKPGITVAINGSVDHLGLYADFDEDSEIHFIPAIEGG